MQDASDLSTLISAELDRLGVACRPIVMMTPWEIGAVTAYLFPTDPITLVDGGVSTPEGWKAIVDAFAAEGLDPADTERIIVTHVHTDHFGGAALIQEVSHCEVFLHPADIEINDPESWSQTNREIFLPLGFTEEMISMFWGGDSEDHFEWKVPTFTPLTEGAVFETGSARLRVEHHAGHSPGHLWVVDDTSGAIFVGDYIIGDHPTNAGLEIDRSHRTGRAQLLESYNAGLRELMTRDAPALFAGHGPPVTDHRELIERRLQKTDRRTRHVLGALGSTPLTALEVGRSLYGTRAETSWEMMADLVGRLDLLVTEGRASSRLGEDGVWYFTTQAGS
jgi:glyoxylase-like metal-dependent hydrolase (beta-lactamase superfamily II)